MIGPGGKGLKRDREESDDDEDDEDEDDLLAETDDDGGSDLEADTDESEEGDELDLELEEGATDEEEDVTGDIDLSEEEPSAPPDPAPATKYVPPHMRAAQLAEKAQGSKEKNLSTQKLERKLQGLLNKYV